jgi:hypothetical protein
MHMIALDKQTGAKVLDEKSAQQPGFRSLSINSAERYIELRGWNDRLRLYAADPTAEAGPAASPAAESNRPAAPPNPGETGTVDDPLARPSEPEPSAEP